MSWYLCFRPIQLIYFYKFHCLKTKNVSHKGLRKIMVIFSKNHCFICMLSVSTAGIIHRRILYEDAYKLCTMLRVITWQDTVLWLVWMNWGTSRKTWNRAVVTSAKIRNGCLRAAGHSVTDLSCSSFLRHFLNFPDSLFSWVTCNHKLCSYS